MDESSLRDMLDGIVRYVEDRFGRAWGWVAAILGIALALLGFVVVIAWMRG
jgi:hypothetical protein